MQRPPRRTHFTLLVFALVGSGTHVAGCADDDTMSGDCDSCDIIGDDDRKDWYEISEDWRAPGVGKSWREVSESVVSISVDTWVDDLIRGEPFWQTDIGLCADEKFSNQPFVGFCTGLLVDDDVILTAGHCLPSSENPIPVERFRFLFNYRMASDRALGTINVARDIFQAVEVIDSGQSEELDYALLRLDRPATPAHPVHPFVRWDHPAEIKEDVVVVSHPNGLPVKFSTGVVLDGARTSDSMFEHTADTLGGSSGAAVFDEDGFLVGIHTRGANFDDFVEDDVRKCDVLAASELSSGVVGWLKGVLGWHRVNAGIHIARALERYCSESVSAVCVQ